MDFLLLLFLVATLAIALAITVPLTGAIVRLRANYNPKGLQLDTEGNVEPHTGPVVTSFFGMLFRVKRIEGWSGLYKGLMPTAMASAVITLFAVLILDATSASVQGRVNPPQAGIFGTLAYNLFSMVISLPVAIITYRSVVTPYKLPYFKPMYSLRILLTPTERRRPWTLYMTPGLLLAQVSHIVFTGIILRTIRAFLLPSLPANGELPDTRVNGIKLGIYIGIEILSSAVLCPLEVLSTKLAIQRNHASNEYNSVEQEVEDDATAVDCPVYSELSGHEEDVIGLRSEKDPYLGLIDCAKKVVDEEGWPALYRAWWLTMLGGIGSALAFTAPYFQ